MIAEKLTKKTEITIIGGGIAGCSLAYCLAKRGMIDVVLIERKELASESSGANFASVMESMFPLRPALLPLAIRTVNALPHLSEELGYDIEYRTPRLIKVWEPLFETFRGYIDKLHELGHSEFRMIRESEIKKMEPYIVLPPYAVFDRRGGQVNPLYLTTALGDKARELGVKIYENTEAVDIKVEKNHIKSVITDKGEIKTHFIVNACGTWAPEIGKLVGLEIPIEPLKCQVLVTEVLPETFMYSGSIGDSKYLLADMHQAEGRMSLFVIIKQMKRGELLLGITEEPGNDKIVTYEAIEAISKNVLQEMPKIKESNVHLISSYANLYAVTPDRHPILGPVNGLDGFIMDCGFNDYGMGHGYGSGEMLAELIIHGEKSFPIEEMRFSRFDDLN